MPNTLTIEIPRPEAVVELDKIRREASERAYAEEVFGLIRWASFPQATMGKC